MLRVYERQFVGPVPQFPREIEDGIDQYLVRQAALDAERDTLRQVTPGSPLDQGAGGRARW